MPRGHPKTYEQRRREWDRDEAYYQRRINKKPLKSPCLKGRLSHSFGRGFGLVNKNCIWCGKSREQIKREQRKKK